MADVHTKEIRSFNMSRIRSKDTKPEILIRRFLHARGFRFRLHDRRLAGKPDIVLPKYHTVIFVHGCFWHGHAGCRYFVIPKTRTEWWMEKFSGNQIKDEQSVKTLTEQGWHIIVVWECELKKNAVTDTFNRIENQLRSFADKSGS